LSRKEVQTVVGKAIRDSAFRERLYSQPDRALGRFDLTQAEVAALRTIDAETLDALAGRSEKDIAESLAAGLYAGMLAAGRHLQRASGGDRADGGRGSLSRDANGRVVESKRFLDWSQDSRKEVRAMKRWKLLSVVASMVAIVALFGFAATATRAPSETLGTDSAEALAKAIAVSSDDDMYGPPPGVPNVYESPKRSVVYEVCNPLIDGCDPWFPGFEIAETTSSEQALPELDTTYSSSSVHNLVPIRRNMPQAYTGYNPQTDPYDPWMY